MLESLGLAGFHCTPRPNLSQVGPRGRQSIFCSLHIAIIRVSCALRKGTVTAAPSRVPMRFFGGGGGGGAVAARRRKDIRDFRCSPSSFLPRCGAQAVEDHAPSWADLQAALEAKSSKGEKADCAETSHGNGSCNGV